MGKKGVAAGALVLLILTVGALTYLDAAGLIKLPVKLPWSGMVKKLVNGEASTEEKNASTGVNTTTETRVTTSSSLNTETVAPTETTSESKTPVTRTRTSETQTTETGSPITTLPRKLEGINVSKLRSIVKPDVVRAEEKAKHVIIEYYDAVRRESLNITRFFDPHEDLRSNILKNILAQGSYLLDEALNLLRQEVREPRTYFTILSGIAARVLSPAKLAVMAGVDSRTMGKYVSLLEDLDIVRRVTPLGRRKPVQVRFTDNYFRFWFSFVKPYQGLIEAGLSEDVLKIIEERWSRYMGSVLEDAVIDIVPELRRAGVIKVLPVKYGRWWRKGEEIDLVIVGEGEAQFIEVKWGSLSAKDVRRTLDNLRAKAMKTGIKFRRSHYTLIAREVKGEASLEKDESAYDLNGLGKLLNVGTT